MELLLPMFALGLVTSLHCVSMCGPMVLTYALKGAEDGPLTRRIVPGLAYQAAKITSYAVVGLTLGAVGSAFDLDAARPYVMAGAGVFMIILAVGMTGRAAWVNKLTPRPPRFLVRALTATRRKATRDAQEGRPTLATPVTFGLLTGLMPCGPLMAAQLSAAASGSALQGALMMTAFGLGTAPLMLGFGTAAGLIPRRVKDRAMAVLAVVVVAFGVTYLNRGAMLLGSSFTLQNAAAAVFSTKTPVTAIPQFTAADGVVEVRLAIENTRFVPAIITLPADTPVRLIVERREANPCSDQLAVPQIGVRADLAPDAVTVVDLPAAAAGTYTLTCGMGMMSGQLRIGAGAAGLPVPPADGAAVTPGSGSGTACACCAPVGTAETVEEQAVIEDGVQRITVSVENGYKPNVVQLAAGVPAEITFGRGSGCMAQVMSEDLGFYEDLTAGPRTVRLEALTVGTYEFSCGMRMVFGTIVVQ